MYVIDRLYRVKNKVIKILDISECTLIDVKSQIDLDTRFFIAVSVKDDPCYHTSIGLPVNLMLLETPFNSCITWTEFENTLTEMWVMSYKEKIPGFIANADFRSALRGYYVFQYYNELVDVELNTTTVEKFTIDYFDHRVWDKRNIPLFKGVMYDLLITGPERLNHKNCVICCNGHMLLTDYIRPMDDHGEQLLVKDGARHLWSTNKNFYPDVICFDFSGLGDIAQYPLSTFKNYNIHYDGKSDLCFRFPELDMTQYTPLVVMAGSLFFPHELTKSGDSVYFNVSKSRVGEMLLKKIHDKDEYISGTIVLTSDFTPLEYLTKVMWEDTCHDAFIILIKNNEIYIEEHLDYQFPISQSIQSQVDIPGILRKRSTGSIEGYVDSKYYTCHLLYLNKESPLWKLSELDNQGVVGVPIWHCKHTNRLWADKFNASDDDSFTTQHISTFDMFNLIS